MERFSTVAALDMQIRYVGNVFDKIYFSIFGKVTPVREAKLTGIQLTDNLNPERNGTYVVSEVITTFGVRGYRQKLKIPYKLSDK